MKNINFKVSIKQAFPLIIFTYSNGVNPLSGFEIEKSDYNQRESQNLKNLLVRYFDLNVYKFLNDQYRSSTDFSFLNEENSIF